jgi:hypothetical protein
VSQYPNPALAIAWCAGHIPSPTFNLNVTGTLRTQHAATLSLLAASRKLPRFLSFEMSVLLETSAGDIVIDLLVDYAPKMCEK